MNFKLNLHFIYVLIAAALWGGAGIFVKAAGQYGIKEMQIVFFRALFSAIILGSIILIRDKGLFKLKLKDIWLFAAAGIFSIVLFNFSYYKTMALTSLSVAAVLLYTAPIFVSILSVILFREKITLNKITALIIAFVGCCFVTGLFSQSQRITATALVFGLTRLLGRKFTEIMLDKKDHKKLKFLNDEKNLEWIFAILYFIIGTPKDVITYFAGITKIKFGVFMVISTLCRIPSILTSAIAGQALGEENYILSVIIFAVSAVIAVLGYLIYHRISKRKEESGV